MKGWLTRNNAVRSTRGVCLRFFYITRRVWPDGDAAPIGRPGLRTRLTPRARGRQCCSVREERSERRAAGHRIPRTAAFLPLAYVRLSCVRQSTVKRGVGLICSDLRVVIAIIDVYSLRDYYKWLDSSFVLELILFPNVFRELWDILGHVKCQVILKLPKHLHLQYYFDALETLKWSTLLKNIAKPGLTNSNNFHSNYLANKFF